MNQSHNKSVNSFYNKNVKHALNQLPDTRTIYTHYNATGFTILTLENIL